MAYSQSTIEESDNRLVLEGVDIENLSILSASAMIRLVESNLRIPKAEGLIGQKCKLRKPRQMIYTPRAEAANKP